MKDLIQQIIAADQEAAKRLEDAKQQKAAVYRSMERKKKELHDASDELMKKELEMMDADQFAKAVRAEEEIGQNAAKEQARLQEIYDRHYEEWVTSIVQNVLHHSSNPESR